MSSGGGGIDGGEVRAIRTVALSMVLGSFEDMVEWIVVDVVCLVSLFA